MARYKVIAPEKVDKNNHNLFKHDTLLSEELKKCEFKPQPSELLPSTRFFAEHSYHVVNDQIKEYFGFVTTTNRDLYDRFDCGTSLCYPMEIERADFARDVVPIMRANLKPKVLRSVQFWLFSGMKAKEAALELGVPLPTLYHHIQKAATVLKKHYYEAI